MLPPNSVPFSISTLVEEEHQHGEPHTRHPGDMWCSQETTELYTMNTEAFTELQACKSFFFQEKGGMHLHHTHISILCLIWCLALCKSGQVTPLLDLAMLPARAVVVLLLTALLSPGFPSNSSSSLTRLCNFRSNSNWLSKVLVRAGFARSFVSYHVPSTWSTVEGFNWCFQ